MLTIEASSPGGPEVLRAVERADPVPGPRQIRVRHQAIGLNFIDTYQRSGLYPLSMPAVLGQEASGLVDAVGAEVTDIKPGDRVGYIGQLGAYAEANVIPADRAIPLPDFISYETAAASLLKGMTTEALLRRCHNVRPGETIVVHAAAGGVGGLMTQWGKSLGAQVVGVVGSTEKRDIALSRGCDAVVIFPGEDLVARVKSLTGGRGAEVVYDGVGAQTLEASLASLARRGLLVSFGNASGPPPAIEPGRLARGGSLYLTRPTVFDYLVTRDELLASAAALFEMIGGDAVSVTVGQTFALADARSAHEALEARRTTGATLLIP